MGYGVQFRDDDGDHSCSLATTRGMITLSEWVHSLPAGYPALMKFVGHGAVDGTHELSSDLRRAMRDHPPKSDSVGHTARGFLDVLGVGHPDESARITSQ